MARRVLFLDDDLSLMRLTAFLTRADFEVTRAAGVDECLRLLQRESYDLLVFDIMMAPQSLAESFPDPLESGMHLIEMIQDRATSQKFGFRVPNDVPIIALTAVPSDTVVERCRALVGDDNVLLKPISARDILKRMNEVLSAG